MRADNAYQQFRNTKEMSQEEIDKAEWMKARNKLDDPAYVQKMIHLGKPIDDIMKTAGYLKEEKIETPSIDEIPSLSDASNKNVAKSKGKEKSKEQTIPY